MSGGHNTRVRISAFQLAPRRACLSSTSTRETEATNRGLIWHGNMDRWKRPQANPLAVVDNICFFAPPAGAYQNRWQPGSTSKAMADTLLCLRLSIFPVSAIDGTEMPGGRPS